ncbi:septal ring lytic transglycosylase RlpA family protein [Patulibacter defluvii]|uniref:septal ring lytic transglycosylase RlpA family protein n=1 Tax=Patulibacter defluvii TaxID=3095358 RepID=UPI002A749712|nr:septal ring lytic transglycosylase RlpA family protein [Patulibacter sp. DM4]
MIARNFARRAAVIGLLAVPALLPATALAADGTGGLTLESAAAAAAAPADTSADLSGAGTWSASPSTVVGRPVQIAGSFDRDLAGRYVRVERVDPKGVWRRAAIAKIRSNGKFRANWRTRAIRYHELRVLLTGQADARKARTATVGDANSADTVKVVVLAKARATWYGPGFYGRKTACGTTLTQSTVGVAHRTLPCGTQVEIRRGGESFVVPVIDRGPFANGATFDLTKNLADDLGVTGVDAVQYVVRADLKRLATPQNAPAAR